MKRYVWVLGAFFIVVLLIAAEMAVISKATEINVKEKAVFARIKIDKNTVIGKDMLELREISVDALHPEALKDIDAAVSKIATMEIEPGELLLKPKLSSGKRGIIEAEAKTCRLFTVEFKGDQANGWQLTAGQLVDIIFVPHDKAQRNNAPVSERMEAEVKSKAEAGTDADAKSKTGAEPEMEPEIEAVVDADLKSKTETGSEALAKSEIETDLESVMGALTYGQVKILKNIRIAGLIDENGKLVEVSDERGMPRYISFEVTREQACFLAYAKKYGQLEISSIPE